MHVSVAIYAEDVVEFPKKYGGQNSRGYLQGGAVSPFFSRPDHFFLMWHDCGTRNPRVKLISGHSLFEGRPPVAIPPLSYCAL